MRVDEELGRGGENRIIAVVGPPGAGKTTTLVKLAARYGVLTRRPTQILTVDTFRIAAAEELRSYAGILGAGFQLLETPASLAQAIEEHSQKRLVLIDTPGLGAAELESFEDFSGFLASHPAIDTHLVLPASMRSRDMQRAAARYAVFRPGKLLFTRLDETDTFGPLLSQSIRMRLPLSFFCGGQRVPEDIEAASPDRVLDLVLKSESPSQPESRFGTAAA